MIVLVSIFLLTIAYPVIHRAVTPGMEPVSEEDARLLDSLVAVLTAQDSIDEARFELFEFDPNSASVDELVRLGFDQRTARQIINYRSSGGQFRLKKDLYKIYLIDSAHLTEVFDYIALPDNVTEPPKEKEKKSDQLPGKASSSKPIEKMVVEKMDLNRADTAMLQTISGIGSVLSKRIVNFREKLGGFVNVSQLYEVYNLDSTVIEALLEIGILDTSAQVCKLAINELSEEELANHPYLSWKQARLIIAYRNQHGNYTSEEELIKVYLVNQSDIDRLRPYLEFD